MTVETNTPFTLKFIGEIVETSRGSESCFVKVTVRQICVELPSMNCDGLHLGDTVAFETVVESRSCRQVMEGFGDSIRLTADDSVR